MPLARRVPHRHAPGMFVVSEKDVTGIRTAFDRGGELSAAIELRRLFPDIIDNEQAGTLARTIAGWKPLPMTPRRPAPDNTAPRGRMLRPIQVRTPPLKKSPAFDWL